MKWNTLECEVLRRENEIFFFLEIVLIEQKWCNNNQIPIYEMTILPLNAIKYVRDIGWKEFDWFLECVNKQQKLFKNIREIFLEMKLSK